MAKKFIVLLTVAFTICHMVSAQYYNTGAPPASQKWRQIKTDSLKMIFPREFEDGARRTLFYMEYVRPYVGYGFSRSAMKTPVVMHTENFYSNGLAMLAPKRIEIGTLPSLDTYSTPWLKQLAAHEYRHMVQYNSLNRSTVKAFSWVFGQQASLLATGLLPFWFLEGDATMAETQFSEFGRGLQPSFTMHYRAAGRELSARRNPDKWFSGSYKDYVPSHYELGYQLIAHSQRKYGKYIWDDIARYGSNFPFLLFTTQLALGKYYDTSTKKLFHETFSHLNDFWDSLPERENSAEIISASGRTYTTYSHPIFLDDTTLLVLKTDYDRPERFVAVNIKDNSERHLCYTGSLSTRPVKGDGIIWWTEYRSTAWEQRVNSVLCYMYPGEWKTYELRGERAAMYPAVTHDNSVAYVKYHYNGRYSIVWGGNLYDFPMGTSLHGLDYDQATSALYYIALSDEGMWIGDLRLDGDAANISKITTPAHITISDLRAADGKLYFGSIASGYDEVHMLDLDTGLQSRISTSQYGSFSGAVSADGTKVAMTTYGRNGYYLSLHPATSAETITPSRLPRNEVNPPIVDWGLPKIDDLVFDQSDMELSRRDKPSRRYSKAGNLFNFHSWVPADVDIDDIIDNFDFNINLGATIISQNLLNTATSSLSYGYMQSGNSLVRAKFNYTGLAPKFEVEALWSDVGQRISLQEISTPAPVPGNNYLQVNARVYLPILLTNGYLTSQLTPNVQYIFVNNIAYDIKKHDYRKDQHLWAASLSYTGSVRRARLELIPKWGYALRGTVVNEPAQSLYATTFSLYGRVYTPGLFRNQGLSLAATYQRALDRDIRPYGILDILPRGSSNRHPTDYYAVSANYYFPIAYPDWGLSGVFFLKRIHANIGYDHAWISEAWTGETIKSSVHSFGGTLRLDVAPLRLPSQGTCTVTLGLYFPSDTGKPYFSAGFSVPL